MVEVAPKSLIGVGIYTAAQAARLARVQTQLITRWVHGTNDRRPAMRAQLPEDPDQLITFLDLIQAMAIRAIRLEKKVPLDKIREFIEVARTTYEVTYPFARRHTTYLFDDDIVLCLPDQRLIQLTGKYKFQDLIREVAEVYMEDLQFDKSSGLAEKYTPLRYLGRTIEIDPEHRFGQPLVRPCGYSVEAILAAVEVEGSPDRAADSLGVEVDDVRIAQRYEDWLLGVAA